MLVQQWLMARPDMRDFLGARPMVPLAESWMPQVDVLKRATGWYDANITHFHDMAVYGEQVLLSVRYGDWVDVTDPNQASNWARYWRPEIQTYIHAYRAATGADLTVEPVSGETPSSLLRKRMALQPAANQ